jgi:hypothetical protein
MADSILDGAKELLVETISALDQASVRDFIVIGGWCPYLRNQSVLTHPGTLDVDLLFKDGERGGSLRPAILALKQKGFILSAKHSFQLLLEKTIRNERLIYNVDLLHPSMSDTNPMMFVDHLDLDIPLDADERRVKMATSIVLPNSAILFQENLFSKFTAWGNTFDLVDFTGMFISKMDSCQKPKRERDAFDLYVALKSGQIDFSTIARIRNENSRINNSLNLLSDYLKKNGQSFDRNVEQFLAGPPTESAAHALRQAICIPGEP